MEKRGRSRDWRGIGNGHAIADVASEGLGKDEEGPFAGGGNIGDRWVANAGQAAWNCSDSGSRLSLLGRQA